MLIRRYEESKKRLKEGERRIRTGKCGGEGKVSKGQLMVNGASSIMFSGLRFLLLPFNTPSLQHRGSERPQHLHSYSERR